MSSTVSEDVASEAWDRYVLAHPDATADHLWGWRQVFERALGHRSAYLAACRNDIIVGVLPLVLVRSRIFGRSAVAVPFLNYGGVLANDEEARQVLVDAATARAAGFGAAYVELRQVQRVSLTLPFRQHKLGMARALPATSDVLWNTLDRKVRNQVRKAQKVGLECATGGAELVGEFYEVFARNMRDLGTPVYPRALFDETLRQFPAQARVTVVRFEGRPVAAAIVVGFRHVVLNPWASSLREFRNLSANVLLYWHLLERATQDGATAFDFGRSSPGGGTHQFKLQWGASETPLHWEYVLISREAPPSHGPQTPTFERAVALWRCLPLPVANLLGPMIARHLP